MFGRCNSLLKRGYDLSKVAAQKRRRIDPKTGKDLATKKTIRGDRQWLEAVLMKHEPVQGPILNAPDHVFLNAVALVGTKLVMQVVALAADGNFGNQLRRPFQVFAANPRTAAALRRYSKKGVRLRFVFQVKADGSVVSAQHARRSQAINPQKRYDIEM